MQKEESEMMEGSEVHRPFTSVIWIIMRRKSGAYRVDEIWWIHQNNHQ